MDAADVIDDGRTDIDPSPRPRGRVSPTRTMPPERDQNHALVPGRLAVEGDEDREQGADQQAGEQQRRQHKREGRGPSRGGTSRGRGGTTMAIWMGDCRTTCSACWARFFSASWMPTKFSTAFPAMATITRPAHA